MDDADEFNPEFQVLDSPALALPAATGPIADPLAYTVNEVLAIGVEDNAAMLFERAQTFDRAAHSHPLVGRVRLGDIVVAPRPAALLVEYLEQSSRAAGARLVTELVPEARLVGPDVDQVAGLRSAHGLQF